MRIDSLGLTPVTAGKPQVQTKEQVLPKAGEILRAQVIAMTGNTIDLQLPDGTVMQAQGALDTELSKGDNLLLMAGKNNGQLKLQILALDREGTGAAQAPVPVPQLIADLQKSPVALLAAKIMQDMGVRVDSDTLTAALAAIKQYPQLKAGEAAFFIANHIEITQENIDTLQRLTSGEGAAGKQLLSMLEALGVKQDPGADTGSPISSSQSDTEQAAAKPEVQSQPAEGKLLQSTDPKTIQAAIHSVTSSSPQSARVLQQLGLTKEAAATVIQAAQLPEAEAKNLADTFTGALPVRIPQQVRDILSNTLQQAAAALKNPGQAPAGTREHTTDAKDVAAKILALFAKLERGGPEAAKNLKEAAAGMEKRLLDLKDALGNTALANKGELAAKTEQVISQSRIMSDNSLFTYIQIPVAANEQNRSAELYIYKRSRKGKRIDPENAVILIGLDTENMGRVETVIRVERRSVFLQFKTEQEGAATSISRNASKLQDMLSEIGYTLAHTRITRLHEKTTPLNAAQTMVQNSRRTSTYVDLRV